MLRVRSLKRCIIVRPFTETLLYRPPIYRSVALSSVRLLKRCVIVHPLTEALRFCRLDMGTWSRRRTWAASLRASRPFTEALRFPYSTVALSQVHSLKRCFIVCPFNEAVWYRRLGTGTWSRRRTWAASSHASRPLPATPTPCRGCRVQGLGCRIAGNPHTLQRV